MHTYPTAIRFLRALRGGTQAKLIKADDGRFYAAKSLQNPQGSRVILNDYLGAKVFDALGILAAKAVPIRVSQPFIDDNPEFRLQGAETLLEAGVYLGSQFPVNPEETALYDFLPTRMSSRIVNRSDFLGALVADQWLANNDQRQFVFYRDQSVSGHQPGYRGMAIDHGLCFGGSDRILRDSPLMGLYMERDVYGPLQFRDFEPWLAKLATIGQGHFSKWLEAAPPDWLCNEACQIETLMAALFHRQKRIPALIDAALAVLGTGRGTNKNPAEYVTSHALRGIDFCASA